MKRVNPDRRMVAKIGLGLATGAALLPVGITGGRAAARTPEVTGSGVAIAPDTADGMTNATETPQGRLIGTLDQTGDTGVMVFKGIPYAVPPVGDRRWRPAEPAPAWEGTRDASAFGPQAIQLTEPDEAFFSLPQSVQSEDCLYLNVWTPAEPGRHLEPLPVMVWIHGGAFTTGAGSIPAYDGAALARKGVVVVTINYRLGVFGYFTHPDLVDEAGGGICANFGTTDQIEALRWVQKNIAAFGGDPNRVTIFGESAGAMSVSQLLASPLTKDLFHGAIGQSGGFFYPMPEIGREAWGMPPAETLGETFSKRIGASSLAELRKMSAHELVHVAASHGDLLNQLGALIVVDGIVFDRQIHDTFRQGKQQAVPVLLGFNSDEGSGIADYGGIPHIADPLAYEAEVKRHYAGFAEEYLALYPADDAQGSTFDMFRDDAFGWHMIEWADLTVGVSQNAFLYYFSHTPPGADEPRLVYGGPNERCVGAHHASEIVYVFNNMNREFTSVWGDGMRHANRPWGPPRPEDIRLADLMSDYWIAFAKTGVPAASGQPQWHPYSRTARHYMRFDAEPVPSIDLLPGMWELHSRINAARDAAGAFWYFGNIGLAGPILPA